MNANYVIHVCIIQVVLSISIILIALKRLEYIIRELPSKSVKESIIASYHICKGEEIEHVRVDHARQGHIY